MVGPNFNKPALPKVKRFTETPLPAKTVATRGPGGQAQQFIKTKDLPLEWWRLYHSKAINELICAGLAHSPNLASAYANLRQAKENLNVQIGNAFWPAVDSTGFAQRQRFSTLSVGSDNGGGASTFNLYNVTVSVSYNLDIFGGAQRESESLRAQVDYQQFEVIAAYLTLTSNIVTTAVSIASYQAQIEATIDLIKAQQQQLDILRQQERLGGISRADVLTQQTLVEQSRATLPPLEKNLSFSRHALSALVGTFPDRPLPVIKLNRLTLPKNLPITLPSNLVRQRPDVRASESLMHAACAKIGVATADLFPKITLSGDYGYTATALSSLFAGSSKVWDIIGQFSQPIFHGGALLAQRRANIAAYQQAEAQYKQTVLQAFQNVADSLRALETDARALQANSRAEDSARLSLALVQSQYRLGGTNYINLLNAQQQYQQTRLKRIQAQGARYSDTAALFQSLGGGWWHKPWCIKECL